MTIPSCARACRAPLKSIFNPKVKNIAEIQQLVKQFPGMTRPALASLSLSIRTGAVTGLVGPDGAGKTTLMRLMAGLMHPTSGTISILGLDPIKESTQLRAVVGYMPQKFGLYEDLSVIENLTLHADLRGVIGKERTENFERLLQLTDLAPFTERLAGKLSGGMKQKLGLCCALLGQPKLLLLDEPGVGVDPISRRELWKMIRSLLSTEVAVIWSTAYLEEAELCDDVLLLNEGNLLFDGTPADLTAQMENRCHRLARIEGNRRQLLTRLLACDEVLDGVIQGNSLRIVLRKNAALPNLAALDAGSNAAWEPIRPRFEDAFLDALDSKPQARSALATHLAALPQDNSTRIEAIDLCKTFGTFRAVRDVNFKVTRGEIFGLLGPNGAGKSTTFKMMCGLLQATAGRALVTGLDLKTSASAARQKLGYMAQKFSLYGNLSVLQNLQFFSGIYGLAGAQRNAEVADMVKIFHLEPYLKTPADTLPLGFKQRLALACSVMHRPEILFLDEPTSGVDPVTRREFWTHINGVVDRGVTVMVTTHFMDEAEYCDRIGLVYRGRLIAAGTPDDLKELVRTAEQPDPSMEDAFIELVLKDKTNVEN